MNQACIFHIQKFSIHDGPGIRTAIFFKGCPLKCLWCSNPESQDGAPEKMWNTQKNAYITIGEYKTLSEILEEVLKDESFYEESGGGVTLSGGEVLSQGVFVAELLSKLKERRIHTAIETTGFSHPEVFEKLIKQTDLLYFDVKHHDEERHREGTGVSLVPILNNLSCALHTHPDVIVRIPIIPGFNDGRKNAEAFAHLFQKIGVNKVELLPFHQFGEEKYRFLKRVYPMQDYPQLHTEDLLYFKEILSQKKDFL